MEAHDHLGYSAVGDTVNIITRIASAASGVQKWISEQTFQQVKVGFQVKSLEPLPVEGKQELVQSIRGINCTGLAEWLTGKAGTNLLVW